MKCPLCGYQAAGSFEACSSCLINSGCTTERCPHCGYRFVEQSALVNLLRRLLRRRSEVSRHGPTHV